MPHRAASHPRRSCLMVCVAVLPAMRAAAQLSPDRTYYGIGRAIPMRVHIPDDAKGEAQVQLLAPADAALVATASVVEGGVDMAGLFPTLWDAPRAGTGVVYAQLVVGARKIGPAVVLQPLMDPATCVFIDSQTQ